MRDRLAAQDDRLLHRRVGAAAQGGPGGIQRRGGLPRHRRLSRAGHLRGRARGGCHARRPCCRRACGDAVTGGGICPPRSRRGRGSGWRATGWRSSGDAALVESARDASSARAIGWGWQVLEQAPERNGASSLLGPAGTGAACAPSPGPGEQTGPGFQLRLEPALARFITACRADLSRLPHSSTRCRRSPYSVAGTPWRVTLGVAYCGASLISRPAAIHPDPARRRPAGSRGGTMSETRNAGRRPQAAGGNRPPARRRDLDLETALALFEEGVKRLKTAQARLEAAEIRVRQVLVDSAPPARASCGRTPRWWRAPAASARGAAGQARALVDAELEACAGWRSSAVARAPGRGARPTPCAVPGSGSVLRCVLAAYRAGRRDVRRPSPAWRPRWRSSTPIPWCTMTCPAWTMTTCAADEPTAAPRVRRAPPPRGSAICSCRRGRAARQGWQGALGLAADDG